VVTEGHLLSHSSHAPTSSKDFPSVLVSSMAFTVKSKSLPMATEGVCDPITIPLLSGVWENLHTQGVSKWRPQCDLLLSQSWVHLSPGDMHRFSYNIMNAGVLRGLTLPYQILCRVAFPMEVSPLTRLCALSLEMYLGASVFTLASQWNMLGPFIKT